MLFQIDLFFVRIFLSLSVQLGGGIVALYHAIKLLRRKKNKMTIPVSMFYIFLGSCYILLAVFIFIFINPITFVAYIVSYNLGLLGYSFNVVFCSNLIEGRDRAFSKWQAIHVVAFMVSVNLLLLVPNSIKLGPDTNWISIYGTEFSILLLIDYTIIVFVPGVYLMAKVLKQIVDKKLKKRIRMFLFGNLWLMLTVYGIVTYIAMPDNLVFRNVWAVFSFFHIIPILLIYYGIKEI